MADPKDYGSGVSQVIQPDGRNWDTLVFESGKPVLDWEQNLQADIQAYQAFKAGVLRGAPSGFIGSGRVLTTPDAEDSGYAFITGAPADTFFLGLSPVYVSTLGFFFVGRSYTGGGGGSNSIPLPAAPAGVAVEHNFVLIEFWRQLIEPAPSTTGKSPLGNIFRNGNVTITDPGPDAAWNYADDLLDPVLGSETTRRVQLQYRLRIVQDVDLTTYERPLDDPSIEAQGPNGAPVATYSYNRYFGDAGLWYTGTGTAADQAALGTVDGYVYAIPVCVITRRNQTAYDMWTNKNGARSYLSAPPADDRNERPDNLYYDQIYPVDLIDLRNFVYPNGPDLDRAMQRALEYVFDNTLETFWEPDVYGPGFSIPVSKRTLLLNEIGRETALGGVPPLSGDSVAGQFIRNMDNVCRRFSDRPILEHPIHVQPSPGTWAPNDSFYVDLANPIPGTEGFNPYPVSTGVGVNLVALAPLGVIIKEVVVYRAGHDEDGTGTPLVDLNLVTGIGTTRVEITLGSNIAGYTGDLWVEVWIQYPPGGGLQRGPYETYALGGIKVFNTASRHPDAAEDDPLTDKCGIVSGDQSLANEADIDYKVAPREVELLYRSDPSSPLTVVVPASSATEVYLPEPADRISTVNGAGTFTHVRGTRLITWTGAPLVPGAATTVDYVALRPLPFYDNAGAPLDWQIGVNYRAPAPQSVHFNGLTEQEVLVMTFSDLLHLITVGSGTFIDTNYPFQAPYDQIPLPAISAVIAGDHANINPPELTSIDDFNATTGYMRILANVPMVAPGGSPNLKVRDIVIDGEARRCHIRTDMGSTSAPGYHPGAMGQGLSTMATHRVLLPAIVELSEQAGGPRIGELYLMLATRYVATDGSNVILLPDAAGDDEHGVAFYRLPHNLLASKLDGEF
jgi:hypothetical protein